MKFKTKLVQGKLIKRYKRFLADIKLGDGKIITAHCPNSGRMTLCQGENWPVLISKSANPKRKLKFTWELVHNGTCWICVNTHLANEVIYEALIAEEIPELTNYTTLEREKKYAERSRIDFLLSTESQRCYHS